MNQQKNFTFIIFIGISILLSMPLTCLAKDVSKLTSLEVSNVSLSQKTFNPVKGEKVNIKFKLSKRANVIVGIYDAMDRLIRVIHGKNMEEDGSNTLIWDGKDQKGAIVPDEAYVYVIYASNEEGEITTFDVRDTGGLKLNLRNPSLDRKTGTIEFVMPKAGRVRVRLGIKDGPLLMTLIDWKPLQAGRHKELWDGKDESGLVDFLKYPGLPVVISAFSLPDNSVITTGNAVTYETYKKTMPTENDFNLSANNTVASKLEQSVNKNGFLHAQHLREDCREPQFTITFPDHPKKEHHIPMLNGIVPVRVEIDQQNKERLTNNRYEIVFYVDNIFLFEEEKGFSPFTYMWNTKGMKEGEHMLTINVLEYGGVDHMGSKNVKVNIRR